MCYPTVRQCPIARGSLIQEQLNSMRWEVLKRRRFGADEDAIH